MGVIVAAFKKQFGLVYLQDTVICSSPPTEQIAFMHKVLMLLKNSEVTLKRKKCRFFTKTVNFLTDIIPTGRLEIASHTKDAIYGLKIPTNLT